MELFKTENLTFSYPDRNFNALSHISLTVDKGEFITLCGKSGSGKSTLLRLLKPEISPHGEKQGNILFEGRNLEELSQREQAEKIGFVMQSPENQIVTDKVWHELAFGLESIGCPTSQIRTKVAEMASFFGIQTWFHKKTSELSGGQKQILNLASVMVMQPSVLLLDEPTSRLDPIAAQDFLEILARINREIGTTVILSEHRLEDAFSMSDRVIVLDEGRLLFCAAPRETGEILKSHPMRAALPTPVQVHAALPYNVRCPITVREGKKYLEEINKQGRVNKELPRERPFRNKETSVSLEDVWFKYEKHAPDVLKGLSAEIKKGEIYAIVGGNSAGKTTALSVINSALKPYRGKVKVLGKAAMLPQNPQVLFTRNSLELDLREMINSGQEKELNEIMEICELESLKDKHPYDLSGGEQQRAALAKVLLKAPDILLLDEPTKGLDAQFKKRFAKILTELKNRGKTVIIVSHDIEFCAAYADRCAMFFDGGIVSEDVPRNFFSGKSFYTTAANRMARGIIPEAILAEDIISACGGNPTLPDETKPPKPKEKLNSAKKTPAVAGKKDKATVKRALISLFILLAVIPLTVYLGSRLLDNRKYYFISLLVLIETMMPFLLIFEKRKPQAREIVLISALSAIAVAGRAVFYMVPQFKPVVAIVIISAVCFGAETGFLVGAVTAFVSNFFFGQGPWTPWQMFALGIIGFLAGVLKLKKNKAVLCVFGGVVTFVVYGIIMNTASVMVLQPTPTLEMLLAAYAAGFSFDLVHAVATVIFLFIISEPMIEKLDRVKIKYGIL